MDPEVNTPTGGASGLAGWPVSERKYSTLNYSYYSLSGDLLSDIKKKNIKKGLFVIGN